MPGQYPKEGVLKMYDRRLHPKRRIPWGTILNGIVFITLVILFTWATWKFSGWIGVAPWPRGLCLVMGILEALLVQIGLVAGLDCIGRARWRRRNATVTAKRQVEIARAEIAARAHDPPPQVHRRGLTGGWLRRCGDRGRPQ
ncbi:MAG: hypothetical protein HY983_03865 [Candidatus Magasanikbacteria bacterium]|nr:hypothetical protein [Candidatus Magasanikbacteria bacterium]